MTALYMLDTYISSYIMKRSHAAVLERLRNTAVGEVCISVVALAELQYGVEMSPRTLQDGAALEAFLRHVEVMDLSSSCAGAYAEIRGGLKRSGAMIGANDLWIAAHARSLGMTLVTNNVREFSRVPGLKIENWTETAD